jgi:hypothetical protein
MERILTRLSELEYRRIELSEEISLRKQDGAALEDLLDGVEYTEPQGLAILRLTARNLKRLIETEEELFVLKELHQYYNMQVLMYQAQGTFH